MLMQRQALGQGNPDGGLCSFEHVVVQVPFRSRIFSWLISVLSAVISMSVYHFRKQRFYFHLQESSFRKNGFNHPLKNNNQHQVNILTAAMCLNHWRATCMAAILSIRFYFRHYLYLIVFNLSFRTEDEWEIWSIFCKPRLNCFCTKTIQSFL